MSSRDAELQAARSESAKSKEQCEEFATRAAAAEAGVAGMQKELRQVQEENGKCQERCEEFADTPASGGGRSFRARGYEAAFGTGGGRCR